MGQILTPDNIPDLVIATTTTVTMATSYLGRDTRITIGGQQYKYSSLITLNFATTGLNGLDTGAIAANTLYYIYAVQSSGVSGLVASLAIPLNGPTGFTAWKEVGRCRTLSTAATLAAIANRDGNVPRKESELIEAVNAYTIGAIVTPPTPGTGTTFYRNTFRDLDIAIVRFELRQTVAGSAGSGDYLLPLMTNLSVDYSRAAPTGSAPFAGTVGSGEMLVNTSGFFAIPQVYNSAGYVGKVILSIGNDATAITTWGSNGSLGNTTVVMSVLCRIPIMEWVGLYT